MSVEKVNLVNTGSEYSVYIFNRPSLEELSECRHAKKILDIIFMWWSQENGGVANIYTTSIKEKIITLVIKSRLKVGLQFIWKNNIRLNR